MSIPPGPGNTTVRRGGWVRGGWVRVLSRVPSSSCPVRWSSGRVFARWGHRRCLYSRGLGTHGSGEWNRPGGGVVGRVLSFLRVVRGVLLGPVGRVSSCPCLSGGRGCRDPRRTGPVWPVGRARRDCWGCGPGPPPSPARPGGPGRLVGWVVGCGVSGRLVRRRCRSGRCAGGTRGRDWTARWW